MIPQLLSNRSYKVVEYLLDSLDVVSWCSAECKDAEALVLTKQGLYDSAVCLLTQSSENHNISILHIEFSEKNLLVSLVDDDTDDFLCWARPAI